MNGIHKQTNIFQSSVLGSKEERTVLEKAEEYGCHREKSNPPQGDVDLVLPTLEISVGDDFELSLEFVNRSDERRVVDAYISGSVVYYTGVTSSEFLFRDPTVKIGPNKSECLSYHIKPQPKYTKIQIHSCIYIDLYTFFITADVTYIKNI